MTVVVKTLVAANPKAYCEIDVELYADNDLLLSQGDNTILLDYRQRQELAKALEEWPPR